MSKPETLAEFDEQIFELTRKRRELEDKRHQEVELPKLRAMVGQCFKYRNCYSCPSSEADYWWMYTRVTGLKDSLLTMISISRDCHGNVFVETDKRVLCPGHRPISEEEFQGAVAPLLAEIVTLVAIPLSRSCNG